MVGNAAGRSACLSWVRVTSMLWDAMHRVAARGKCFKLLVYGEVCENSQELVSNVYLQAKVQLFSRQSSLWP